MRLQAARVHRDLVVDQRAEDVEHRGLAHRRRRIEVRRLLRAGTGEVDGGLARGLVDRDLHRDRRAVVHLVFVNAPSCSTSSTRRTLPRRCPARVACTRAPGRGRNARPSCSSSPTPRGARRHLRPQVGQVLVDVARRIPAGAEQRAQSRLARKRPSATSWMLSNSTPSSSTMRRVGRHRARRDAADVGMVAARRDEKSRPVAARSLVRDSSRNTGMTTVTSGRCVPPLYGAFSTNASPGCIVPVRASMMVLHALAHRAQMHRHVRRVRDQVAVGIEQRAGKIEPLLDVDRIRRILQRHAHLLGDRHEQVVEDFEQHRVGRACRSHVSRCERDRALQHQMVARASAAAFQPGSITVVAFFSAMTAGPGDHVTGKQRLAHDRPAPRATRRR